MSVPPSSPTPQRPDRRGDQQLAYEPPSPERPASVSPTQATLENEALGHSHDAYAAWRHRDFRLFAVGWIVSLVGQQMQSTAIGYEIYHRTGSAMSLGWIGLVQAIPVLLLALPAGHVADRYDRRNVMIWAQILAALASVALAVMSFRHWDYRWMYVPPLITNIGFTFSRAARQALLPSFVPERDFPNAVTWNSSIFETSSVVGPFFGGLVVAWSFAAFNSAWIAYTFTVVGQSAYLIFLLMIPKRPVVAHPATNDRRLSAGIRFVWRSQIVLAAMTLDLFAVLLGGATYLLPVFAHDIFKVGPVGFGLLRLAPAAGALSMAMIQAHLPPMKKAGRALLWSVAGFGIATIIFGLSRNFLLSIVMLYLTGLFDNISVVVRHTLVQLKTPDAMRGRVSAVNNVFIGASNELGGFESGLTAKWIGAVGSVVVGGIGTVIVVGLVAVIWPDIRRFGALHEAAPEEPGDDPQRGFEVLPPPAA